MSIAADTKTPIWTRRPTDANEGEWTYKVEAHGVRLFVGDKEAGWLGNHSYMGNKEQEANARRIVTAMNCHEELVGLVEEYRECKQFDKAMGATVDFSRIDAVLAKAKGGVSLTHTDALVKLARDYRKLLVCLLAQPDGCGDAPALMRCVAEVDAVLEKVREGE